MKTKARKNKISFFSNENNHIKVAPRCFDRYGPRWSRKHFLFFLFFRNVVLQQLFRKQRLLANEVKIWFEINQKIRTLVYNWGFNFNHRTFGPFHVKTSYCTLTYTSELSQCSCWQCFSPRHVFMVELCPVMVMIIWSEKTQRFEQAERRM